MVDPACLIYRADSSWLHGQPCLSFDPCKPERLDHLLTRPMAVLSTSRSSESPRRRNKFSRHHVVDWRDWEVRQHQPPTDGYVEGDVSSNNLSYSDTDQSTDQSTDQAENVKQKGGGEQKSSRAHCSGIVGFRYHCNGDERVEKNMKGPWKDRHRERRLVKNLRDNILKSAYTHTIDQKGDYVINPHPPDTTWLEKHPPRGLHKEGDFHDETRKSIYNQNFSHKNNTNKNSYENRKSILNQNFSRKNTTNNNPGENNPSLINQQVEIKLDQKAGILKRRVSQYKSPIEKNAENFLQQSFKFVRRVTKAMRTMEQDGDPPAPVLHAGPRPPRGSRLYRAGASTTDDCASSPTCPAGKFHPGVNSSVMRHRKPWLDFHLQKEMTNMHQNKLQMKEYLDSVKKTKQECQLVKEGITPVKRHELNSGQAKTGHGKNDTQATKPGAGFVKQSNIDSDSVNIEAAPVNTVKYNSQAVKTAQRKLDNQAIRTGSPMRSRKLENQATVNKSIPSRLRKLDSEAVKMGSPVRPRKLDHHTNQAIKTGTPVRPRKLDDEVTKKGSPVRPRKLNSQAAKPGFSPTRQRKANTQALRKNPLSFE